MHIKTWLRRWKWRASEKRFKVRFDEFLQNEHAVAGDHELLLSAFLASQGSTLTSANEKIRRFTATSLFDLAPDTLGLANDLEVVPRAIASLRSDGYSLLPVTLDPQMQERLTHHLSEQECRMVSDDAEVNGRMSKLNLEMPEAEVYQVSEPQVVSSPDVQRLLIDRTLLSVASGYLGTQPKISNAMAWFTFPRSEASEEAAQKFHFDLERIRWLKVFFFLTDVTADSGPHVFIPTTQIDGAIPRELLDHGYDRMSDDAVGKVFPPALWKSMTGPKGCILLEDTRGLHKGTPVLKGHRLVLQFQYSSSYFGSECSFASGYPAQCDEWMEFSGRHPEVLPPRRSHNSG